MTQPAPTFAVQRIICFALLFGMTLYAIVAAVVLQMNEGVGLATEPIEVLENVVLIAGISIAALAAVLRMVLRNRAEAMTGSEQGTARFAAVLVPLAMLEGGCLFAITVWLLNGNAVPSLAVALVLLAIAIAIVPFSDPNAR